jgi:MFS family permease
LGDRIGFRPVLVGALLAGGVALALMPTVAPLAGIGGAAALAIVVAACISTTSSMVFGLLATEVPPERRSQTLNLVYLPLYAAGIVGPALGAVVSSAAGLSAPFMVGGAAFVLGAALVLRLRRSPAGSAGG